MLLFLFFVPDKVFATDNFSSSYEISFQVDSDGITQVFEKITLKNLTKDYYPDNFKQLINSTQIFDVKATDSTGSLLTKVEKQINATQIEVKFTQQLIGLNRELIWNLSYKSRDFAQKSGKNLQIRIPKIPSLLNLEKYDLTVTVPNSFGSPAFIIPVPDGQINNGEENLFKFNKKQLLNTGISMDFGAARFYDFNLGYHLQNNNFLPVLTSIVLPPDTTNQRIIYQVITPKPLNITADEDGNYLAWYKLQGWEKLDINASASARVYINSTIKQSFLDQSLIKKYTDSDKLWVKDNPKIQGILKQVLGANPPALIKEKARLIYQYVLNTIPETALSSEFTNSFITLSRAAGIPAREMDGFAYAANPDLRPKEIFHIWPEYFDEKVGWVMVDPAWESTTGGVNYFDKLDLNHLTFVIKSSSGLSQLRGPDEVNVRVKEVDLMAMPKLNVSIQTKDPVWAGFPSKIIVKVSNEGNLALPSSSLQIESRHLNILSNINTTGIIPAFGFANFEFDVKTKSLFDSINDEVALTIGQQKFSHELRIVPFIIFQKLPIITSVILAAIWVVYLFIAGVFIHKKRFRRKKSSKKKV